MAINKDSTTFTFGFAFVMVVVVASLLSLAAMGLKPMQKENQKQEKMVNILGSIGVETTMEQASEEFYKYVKERISLDHTGNVKAKSDGKIASLADGQEAYESDAFNVDVKKEFRALPADKRTYPLYVCEKDGKTYYVVPMVGKGLWGPIWGFVALEPDQNTVYGATFDHKTETPGLGAEIASYEIFQKQFEGKKIMDDGKYVSIKVVKGDAGDNPHKVDGITGGTITSTGVSEMLDRTLAIYVDYFKSTEQTASL